VSLLAQRASKPSPNQPFLRICGILILGLIYKNQESRIKNRARHIALVDWADVVVVVPATANIIGKIANGICDDLLSTILCAAWPLIKSGAALLAPAMNNNMWDNPAVQRNVKTVKQMGFQLIGPVKGRLACGTEAIGRMAEPQDIIKSIENIATKIKRESSREDTKS